MNEPTVECLLCGSPALLKKTDQKGYQEPDLFSIYHCPHCNTSFSLPRVDASAVYQLIYEKGRGVPAYDKYWRYLEDIKREDRPMDYLAASEPIYWGLMHAVREVLKVDKRAKIIEVGSGLGYTTYSFRKEGYLNTIGLDISQEAVDRATERLGPYYLCADVYEYAKEKPESVDLIFLTEVIEHIEEPERFIKTLLSLLKKGGVLILTTPNRSFVSEEIVWVTDNPPVHCWWFGEESFHYLARKLHVDLSFVDFSGYYKKYKILIPKPGVNASPYDQFVFNKEGELFPREEKRYGILPAWLKKTALYKKLSATLYPRFSRDFIVPGERTFTLCAILKKPL